MFKLGMRCLLVAVGAAVWAAFPGVLAAEEAPPAPGCTDPEYRRLDFKLGEFEVTGIGGARAGDSRVESVLGGLWRLIYVTDDGDTMYLSGRFEGDTLVLTGENDFDVFTGLHRMSFSQLPGGGSRQFWELSTDGGATWKVVHEGTYARRQAG